MWGDKERISLTEEDFKALVKGEIIHKNSVDICLQDIGFECMLLAIRDAIKT